MIPGITVYSIVIRTLDIWNTNPYKGCKVRIYQNHTHTHAHTYILIVYVRPTYTLCGSQGKNLPELHTHTHIYILFTFALRTHYVCMDTLSNLTPYGCDCGKRLHAAKSRLPDTYLSPNKYKAAMCVSSSFTFHISMRLIYVQVIIVG